jgi:hypothetical protein
MVGYDLTGTAYIADEYGDSEGLGYGLIAISKSTDGVNWSQPIVVASLGFSELLYASMVIDTSPTSPYANSVYVSSVILGEPMQSQTQVAVSQSRNGGATWVTTMVDSQQAYPAEDDYTRAATSSDGTVYVTWQHCESSGPQAGCQDSKAYMLFSKSDDGGMTWADPIPAATVSLNNSACHCGIGDLPNTNDVRLYDYPAVGADKTSGPYAGTIYVAVHNWNGTHLEVQVVHSTDDGNTWSKPILIAPTNDTHDQFFPSLSVSPGGLVGVSWLDRRNDPNNVNYQAFAAISSDGGRSFQPNVQLTTKFSNPNNNGGPGNRWMGDYTGNTWDGPNYFITAWMDSSNGVDMQEEVSGIRLK